MEVKFFWRENVFSNHIILEPACWFYEHQEQKKMNLSIFLIDDEGLGRAYLKKWIHNGLDEIKKIKSGEISDFDMWGQSMGAEISLGKVIVYCGDDYFPEEEIGFNAFYEILVKWLEFISSPADLNKEIVFEVNMDI